MFFDAGATTADAGPTTPGPQGLTAPATDADTNGNPDIEDALQTATIGTTTNFEAGGAAGVRARLREPTRARSRGRA